MNLTRILSEEDGMVLHLEDSVLGLPYVNDAPVGLYGDLGTGGGFPGIPLCVLTGRETLLVDSVKKKVRALEPVAEELGVGDCLSRMAAVLRTSPLSVRGSFRCSRLAP